MSLVIRPGTPQDAPAVSRLIGAVASSFTISPDGAGAEAFLATVSPEGIARALSAPNMDYLLGHVDGELAGVVAVRDGSHLFHLFVAPRFQRKGYAKALWEFARARAVAARNPPAFTVFSTPSAKPVYERFGFAATGPLVQKDGIHFIPMRLSRG